MWRNHTRERAPLWPTYLIFVRSDGQCLIPPVIVHPAGNYIQDLHYNIPKDWVVQNTPSGYMERDVWINTMVNFNTVYGENKINIQLLYYDDHEINFYEREIHIPHSNHIKPLFFKAGDSVNDQPNDNGPNLQLKGLYGQSRMSCQRQHGTLKFTNPHMNYVLVETWRYF